MSYITPEGYILTRCPNHPFCNKKGYVREHRLVMEKKINRYLSPKERVHHINEIKDDNRIENLQLFANHIEHVKIHNPLADQGFKKGIASWMRGKKGIHMSPKTEFKKGNKPPHTGVKGWTNSGSFKKGHPYFPKYR